MIVKTKSLALVALVAFSVASPLSAGLLATLNEIRVSEPGGDINNFFEVAGDPNQSLAGVTMVAVSSSFNAGLIEFATDLGALAIPADGYLLAHQTLMPPDADVTTGDDYFGSATEFMLVSGFTGTAGPPGTGDDLDTDNDGVLDAPAPWDFIIDGVLNDGDGSGAGFNYFNLTTVGPDGSFTAAHIYRLPNGNGPWNIGDFGDQSLDTPGAANIPEPTTGLLVMASVMGLSLLRRR